MISSVVERVTSGRLGPRWSLQISGAISAGVLTILVAALLGLALGEGGRQFQTLTLVQILVFALGIACLGMGPVHAGRSLTAMASAIIMMAFTALWSVRLDSSIRTILLWLMYLGIVLIVSSMLTGLRSAKRLVDGIIVIGGVLCLIGLYFFWSTGDPRLRWYSTFYSPNVFATFLLLMLPLSALRYCLALGRREIFDYGAVTAILAIAIILTFSRGAYVALAVTGLVAALIIPRLSWRIALRRIAIVAVLTAVIVSGLIHTPGSVLKRTASVFESGSSSLQDRLSFWRSGVRILYDHPAVGTGPGTFAYVHSRYLGRYYSRDAHNLYVQMLAEMGLVGLAALLLLFGALGSLWMRNLRYAQGREEYPLVAGAGLSLVAFFLHSGVEMSWQFPAIPAVAFALVGLLEWYGRTRQADTGEMRLGGPPRPAFRITTMFVLAAGITVALTLQSAERQFLAGRQLIGVGKWSEASGRFRRAMMLNPVDPRLPSTQAVALLRTATDIEDAVLLIRKAASLDRMNAYYPLQLAEALLLRARDAAALHEVETQLTSALELDPLHYPEAYARLAQLYVKQGRARDAGRVYERAVAFYADRSIAGDTVLRIMLWPRVAALFSQSATFLAAQGSLEAAVHVLDLLLRQDPGWQPAYRQIADLYRDAGRYHDAYLVLVAGRAYLPDQLGLSARFPRLPGTPRTLPR